MIPLGRTVVDSSNIKAVQWDDNGTLTVEFRNGGVYEYDGITAEQAERITHASSVGKALKAHTAGKAFRKIS